MRTHKPANRDLDLRDRVAEVAHLATQNGLKVSFHLSSTQMDQLRKACHVAADAPDPKAMFGHEIKAPTT